MTQTFAIECPLRDSQEPKMVREEAGEVDVSLRFEDDTSVPSLVSRFLGDRCEFVPPSKLSGKVDTDIELWTTECPLSPGASGSRACFVRSQHTGR